MTPFGVAQMPRVASIAELVPQSDRTRKGDRSEAEPVKRFWLEFQPFSYRLPIMVPRPETLIRVQ